jgi:hypothetical protein
MRFPQLNLPSFEPRIQETEGGTLIFDPVRKKFVTLTQEEWVRQHFLNLLIGHLGYPTALLKAETGMIYHQSAKRTDILAYHRTGAPYLLVECKAPTIPIDANTLKQAAEYNKVLTARYLAVTNGLRHLVWELIEQTYVPLNEFPRFNQDIDG